MRIRQYLFLVLLAMVSSGSAARAMDASVDSQYPVIAAYIYNFTQFTTWPENSVRDSFSVCVLGRDPFGASLYPLRTRTVNNKKIVTRYYRHLADDVSACNVLFIADSEREDMDSIVKTLKDKPVLTMSDADDFVGRGGMVEFEKRDSKIGIKIGLHSVQNAGISISSKLLRIADTEE